MKLPVHRWFRYSAGFSAKWVEEEILRHSCGDGRKLRVLDPFAGSGTTLLAAEAVQVKAVGFEAHPFIHRVAKAKLGQGNTDTRRLQEMACKLVKQAKLHKSEARTSNIPLLIKCFTEEALCNLDALKDVFLADFNNGTVEDELLWLCITSILRPCSTAGTAQWQYVLPNKKKAKVADPFDAFAMKINQLIDDIRIAEQQDWSSDAEVFLTDARDPQYTTDELFDLILTSPPYPNNYDYADATRLEMTFWGEIQGWSELHSSVRQYLLRSCSQHAAREKLQLDMLLEEQVLSPIRDALTAACRELERVRLTKGGKKTYHTMAAAYFIDLGNTFSALRPLCREGGRICFVVGDSAPYGVYLAVDKWLGELALAAGFSSYSFEKLRDRNIKWKNRKHRVPLQEGRLWIEA
ncbi:MAG: DNA modification methylase [Candidatus Electrothrix sp. AUS1_2]|nr:DNA modification methylase [Candidatus Electrothrix sp. AUS1_2]